jgi:hypothetical protein
MDLVEVVDDEVECLRDEVWRRDLDDLYTY